MTPGQVYVQPVQVVTYGPEGQSSGQPGIELQAANGSSDPQRFSGGNYSAAQPAVAYIGGYPVAPAAAAPPEARGKKTKTVLIVLVVIFVGIPVSALLFYLFAFCISITGPRALEFNKHSTNNRRLMSE